MDQNGAGMEVKDGRIPPGPQEQYQVSDDLLDWMGRQFSSFGDIYKASIYGTIAYVIRDVEFAHHVLVENWQNYARSGHPTSGVTPRQRAHGEQG